MLPFVFNYIKSNAETTTHPDSLDGIHGLHQLNFAGGYYGQKCTPGKGKVVELERVTGPLESLSVKSTKISGIRQGSKYAGPYHLTLGVTRFAGGGENAAAKLRQHVSLANLYESGAIDANDLTTNAWHEKTNSFLEKQDKLNLKVAVNGAHRKVLEDVGTQGIVAVSNLDQLLTDASRNEGGKKGIKAQNADANKVAAGTVAHAATIKLKRSAAMSMGFEHFFTHTTIYDLLFSTEITAYASIYNYKDIKSVTQFSKYFGDVFGTEHCTDPLDDTKCPFNITQKMGTTDFFAELKQDFATHFPTLEEMEHCLTKGTLDLMFVKTLSGPMKQYLHNKDKLSAQVSSAQSDLSLKAKDAHVHFTVCQDKGDGAMQEKLITIGDKQVIGQKWMIQIEGGCSDNNNTQIPMGTLVEISKFSRSNNENYVVKEGSHANIVWKSFTTHYSTFVVPEESTPPLAAGNRVEEEKATP